MKSSAMLLCLVISVLVVWHFATGKIAVDQVTSRTDEIFYWVTILVSNTLGTALGDFTADTAWLRKGSTGFRGPDRARCGRLLRYQRARQHIFLVRVYFDAATGRNTRRYAYQTTSTRRTVAWPNFFFTCDDGCDDRCDRADISPRASWTHQRRELTSTEIIELQDRNHVKLPPVSINHKVLPFFNRGTIG